MVIAHCVVPCDGVPGIKVKHNSSTRTAAGVIGGIAFFLVTHTENAMIAPHTNTGVAAHI